MLRLCLPFLRKRGGATGSVHQLRRELQSLQAANRAAGAQLRERRRLATLLHRRQHDRRAAGGGAADAAAAPSLALLPRNEALDTAVALTLCANRDARTELELVRRLLGSTLLSLASPVGPWDPYDVKPQVFALDTYLALPVFTSLAHLQLFCDRFGFVTRDPSGALWADGTRQGAQDDWKRRAVALLPDFGTTELSYQQHHASRDAAGAEAVAPPAEDLNTFMDAGDLFDDLDEVAGDTAAAPATAEKTERGAKKERRKKTKKRSQKRKQHPQAADSGAAEADAQREAQRQRFWERLGATHAFNFAQATPLPTFGPFVRPFFVGYFADVDTLLHNASIVPEKVDIVLNPTSPTEFVLAREATDRVLHKDQLVHIAYQRVERELQREFSIFFDQHCAEVRWAASACVPRPLDLETAEQLYAATQRSLWRSANPLQEHLARTQVLRELDYSNRVLFDLVVLVESDDLAETFAKIQQGKHRCALVGHQDLDVVPVAVAAPHVREIAKRFYDRACASAAAEPAPPLEVGTIQLESPAGAGEAGQQPSAAARMGAFRRVGLPETINIAQDADSYYHDPTNNYTEAHAVFTEELRLKRNV
ncbi:hypothetical protein STCU_05340 [Strigomonas culicis]|uniref:Uncharacterized protein n=1 Tax=Strigomonas culicis TaxID=28005 RepID=S9UB57_9TRYP|nr:hypothetical protein STCU_08048 [Strigomonas culicis]EPY28022.1 hypothetical protein STCU_05340 [Strigomonas culicis]|eukprot:EPY22911.1 hypothetical protein STCU_08048 [Strigomonas culicis]